MKDNDGTIGSGIFTTIMGTMCKVLIPVALLGGNPKKVGKALLMFDFQLSKKQVRLIELLVEGKTNSEIAIEFSDINERSVGRLLEELYKQMDVTNRTKAALIGTRYGL